MAIHLGTLEKLGLPASSKKILRMIRKGNISQEVLAKKAGISMEELNRVLFEPETVKLTVWQKICTALDLTPGGLVAMKEPEQ